MRIGFIQGRLSPQVGNLIQAFPWDYWKNEFEYAKKISINLMEWTLDHERLYENPLMTDKGRKDIEMLCSQYQINIPSVTADCFMQKPFWKSSQENSNIYENEFLDVIYAMKKIGASMIVVPLVDNGSLENTSQENRLLRFMELITPQLEALGIHVTFESDYPPLKLAKFIHKLDDRFFGINYDVGNSASAGYSVKNEITEYGNRILNVHIKDRLLNGGTVALGSGNADFETFFSSLANFEYKGNFILQTARATNGDHIGKIAFYKDMVNQWIKKYGFEFI